MNQDEVLNIAIEVGTRLLENGAEISRVEESIQRVIQAYGNVSCDVFAIPSCIIVSIPKEGTAPQTRIKRIYERDTNLGKVSQLNDLSRRICANLPSADQIKAELSAIDSLHGHQLMTQVLAFALISSSFTLLFGGSWIDASIAVICGACLKMVVYGMSRFHANRFFINMTGSALTTVIAFLMARLGFAVEIDNVIIGTLMNLVPGVAITTGMRDIIAGDLVAGQAKLVEALMTATAIALGSGSALALMRLL